MNAEREIDRLFEQPLDRFTSERNDLAKKLRTAGDRDAAATVAKIRKPSAPAWAINRVVRAHADLARAVLAAGDALRDAQRRVLRGGDTAAMRDATTAERTAVNAFVALAEKELRGGGLGTSAATIERVRDTVFAVSTDAALHQEFLAGRLTDEHQRAGFGEFPDLKLVDTPTHARAGSKKKQDRADVEERRRRQQEERLAELRANLTEAEDEAADLERRARSARRRADELGEQVASAERARKKR